MFYWNITTPCLSYAHAQCHNPKKVFKKVSILLKTQYFACLSLLISLCYTPNWQLSSLNLIIPAREKKFFVGGGGAELTAKGYFAICENQIKKWTTLEISNIEIYVCTIHINTSSTLCAPFTRKKKGKRSIQNSTF